MSEVFAAIAVIALLVALGFAKGLSDRWADRTYMSTPDDWKFYRKAAAVCLGISAVCGLLAWWLP